MAGLAVGMLAIMFVVGRPEPPARPAAAAASAQAPSADRVRDYQDRLRALEAQALRDAQAAALSAGAAPGCVRRAAGAAAAGPDRGGPKAARVREPLRQQRRAEPAAGDRAAGRRASSASQTGAPRRQIPRSPSVDEVADAVVRATTRAERLAPDRSSAAPLRSRSRSTRRQAQRHVANGGPERRSGPDRSAPPGRCIASSKAPSSTPS